MKRMTPFLVGVGVLALNGLSLAAGPSGSLNPGNQSTMQGADTLARCSYTYDMKSCVVKCSPAPCEDYANKCGSAVQNCNKDDDKSSSSSSMGKGHMKSK